MNFYRNDARSQLRNEYEKRIKQEEAQISELELDGVAIAAEESQWARRHLLLTEKNHASNSFRQGLLDQEIYEKLLADIDARLLRLESGHEESSGIAPDLDDPKR